MYLEACTLKKFLVQLYRLINKATYLSLNIEAIIWRLLEGNIAKFLYTKHKIPNYWIKMDTFSKFMQDRAR